MAYIYQAPKDFDEQSVKVKQKYGSIAGMLHSGEYDLQLKYDGVFSATYTTSAISETRQQKAQPSAARIASALKDVFGSNMLVLSELWTKGLAHKAINGMSRRDEVQQELGACIFDMISVDEFNEGRCSMPYAERYERIKTRLDDVGISWIQPAQNVVIEDVLGTTEEALIKLGYLKSASDGNFGTGTKTAVENFQKENGLDVDGIAGAKTLEKLYTLSDMTPMPDVDVTAAPGDILDLPG